MEKRLFKMIPYIFIVGVFYMVSLMSIITGVANINIQCFSVDSSERLYVGLFREILVFDEGTQINSFSPRTSHSYMFRVQSDDTIILSTASTVYLLDLNGNEIESWEDRGAGTFNELQYGKRHQSSKNGTQYSIRAPFGWTRIVRDGTDVVYKISTYSYIMKIVFILCFGFTIFCASYCVGKKK